MSGATRNNRRAVVVAAQRFHAKPTQDRMNVLLAAVADLGKTANSDSSASHSLSSADNDEGDSVA